MSCHNSVLSPCLSPVLMPAEFQFGSLLEASNLNSPNSNQSLPGSLNPAPVEPRYHSTRHRSPTPLTDHVAPRYRYSSSRYRSPSPPPTISLVDCLPDSFPDMVANGFHFGEPEKELRANLHGFLTVCFFFYYWSTTLIHLHTFRPSRWAVVLSPQTKLL